ncbi:MAG TPA: hypothetical protein PLM07_05655 [Candidatus Rifleibacterium sp.]|nr:hypothetical protein [Candidatus Rifleibacterium sp.]HPT45368.1 hypothetical protein [Candidatus Rifleibacterium sp.]
MIQDPCARIRFSSAALITFVLLLTCSSALLAQLPLPPLPFPDPFGIFGNTNEEQDKAIDGIVGVGMTRNPTGTAPYGTTSSGEPFWPVPEPEPAKTVIGVVETGKATPAALTSPATAGQVSNEKHNATINCLIARNSFEGGNISPLVNKTLIVGEKSNLPGRPAEEFSEKELAAMQYSFIYDLQRHARFIYEGKNAMAAAITCKWKLIGSQHANQIDEITFNIANKNGFPKFSLWIESVLEQDRKFVENP